MKTMSNATSIAPSFPLSFLQVPIQIMATVSCSIQKILSLFESLHPFFRVLLGGMFLRWLHAVGDSLRRGESKTIYEAVRSVSCRWIPFGLEIYVEQLEENLAGGEALSYAVSRFGLLLEEDRRRIAQGELDGSLVELLLSFPSPPLRAMTDQSSCEAGRFIVDLEMPMHKLLELILLDTVLHHVETLIIPSMRSAFSCVGQSNKDSAALDLDDLNEAFEAGSAEIDPHLRMRAFSEGREMTVVDPPPLIIVPNLCLVCLALAGVPYWSPGESHGRIDDPDLPGVWDVCLGEDKIVQLRLIHALNGKYKPPWYPILTMFGPPLRTEDAARIL